MDNVKVKDAKEFLKFTPDSECADDYTADEIHYAETHGLHDSGDTLDRAKSIIIGLVKEIERLEKKGVVVKEPKPRKPKKMGKIDKDGCSKCPHCKSLVDGLNYSGSEIEYGRCNLYGGEWNWKGSEGVENDQYFCQNCDQEVTPVGQQ